MITEEQIRKWKRESTEDDEYDNLCWGSRDRIQRLIKEVIRLNKLLDVKQGETE